MRVPSDLLKTNNFRMKKKQFFHSLKLPAILERHSKIIHLAINLNSYESTILHCSKWTTVRTFYD
jgi:hypothetical protein